MIYITLILIFLFLLSLFFVILSSLLVKEKAIEKLKFFDEDHYVREKVESKKKKQTKTSIIKMLAKILPNLKFNRKSAQRLESELIKADLQITVEELLVVKLLSTSTLSFLAFSLTKDVFLCVLVLLFIWFLPNFIITHKKNKRVKQFNKQINDGIVIISNSLKAGYSFLQAVTVVAEETQEPFSKEFKKLLKEMNLGVSLDDSLRGMLKRVDSEDLKLIVNAILIQKDIGGNLSEILDIIAETIRERQKIQHELKALTAQGKMSGFIIVLIPVFIALFLYFFNKEFIMLLFTTKIGIIMLSAAFINQIIGIFFIRKIINVEV